MSGWRRPWGRRVRDAWESGVAAGRGWAARSRREHPGAWRVGGPIAVSVGVHACLGMVAVVVWGRGARMEAPGAGGMGTGEVEIDLQAIRSDEGAPREPQGVDATGPASAIGDEYRGPPTIQGMTSAHAPGSATALRSLGTRSDGVGTAPALRRAEGEAGTVFAGARAGRAESVVYAVDASGAMVTSLTFIKRELERSIAGLDGGQRFQVVLFRSRGGAPKGYELYDRAAGSGGGGVQGELVPATDVNRRGVSAWLEGIDPAGRSNPLDGLRAALALGPDVVFLLSHSFERSSGEASGGDGDGGGDGGWGGGAEEILAELDRLNPQDRTTGRRRSVIKTIQFVREDPTGTMQAIGHAHGDGEGSYRVVSLEELGGGR